MGFNLPENIQYCAEFVSELQVLLLYSHIATAVAILLVSSFIVLQQWKRLESRILFMIGILFSIWTTLNLTIWFGYGNAPLLMAAWTNIDLVKILLFLFCAYFVHVYRTQKDVGPTTKFIWILLILPVALLGPTGYNLVAFDIQECVAVQAPLFKYYVLAVQLFFTAWMLIQLTRSYLASDARTRKHVLMLGTGILFFTSVFLVSGRISELTGNYKFELYGLFGMIPFVGILGYLLLRTDVFNIRGTLSQITILLLIFLTSTLYFTSENQLTILIVSFTLLMIVAVGILLIRSIRVEQEQKTELEKQKAKLEVANKQQVILIHFITHQIKGFVTKSRNIFSLMKDGDLGPIPEAMKPMIEEGFRSDTKGVTTIQEILNAANIKSGKVAYNKEPFDLKALVDEIGTDLKSAADAKGLSLTLKTGSEPLLYPGDKGQLVNALKNLIDNSIKYTLKGEVTVSLAQEGKTVRFTVEDTGVGITEEDMKNLFTEGGHGVNSAKINVESTGFGLYIVKNIIEAHNGKVWAESEGEGKGSRFIVELPV